MSISYGSIKEKLKKGQDINQAEINFIKTPATNIADQIPKAEFIRFAKDFLSKNEQSKYPMLASLEDLKVQNKQPSLAEKLAAAQNAAKKLSSTEPPQSKEEEILNQALERAVETATVYEKALRVAQIKHKVLSEGKENISENEAELRKTKEGQDKLLGITKSITANIEERKNKLQKEINKIEQVFGFNQEEADLLKEKGSRALNDDEKQKIKEAQEKRKALLYARFKSVLDEISEKTKEAFQKIKSEESDVIKKTQKMRQAADKIVEEILNKRYPNHNDPKYIQERKNKGLPDEPREQRLPGAIGYALNPVDIQLSNAIMQRRENGVEDEEEILPLSHRPKPEIVIENQVPRISIDHPIKKLFFFTRAFSKALEKEQGVKISLPANVSLQDFKAICSSMQNNINQYSQGGEEQQVFSGIVCKESKGHNNAYEIASENKPLIEIAHFSPEKDNTGKLSPGKIEFLLKDPEQKDESLLLMVVSAKNMLEKLGSKELNIEGCENNPEIAVKLYLAGLSLGLLPKFKDGNGKTLKSIQNSEKTLSIDGKQISLMNAIENADRLRDNPEGLKKYMDALEINPIVTNHHKLN